jgi:hypothetical protein
VLEGKALEPFIFQNPACLNACVKGALMTSLTKGVRNGNLGKKVTRKWPCSEKKSIH